MPKKPAIVPDEDEMTPLEKATSHKVSKQTNKKVSRNDLAVYLSWFNGEIDSSQACYGLGLALGTFRSKSGPILRDAIIRGDYQIEETTD